MTELTLPCPRCGKTRLAYNGNYYCQACPWALNVDGSGEDNPRLGADLLADLKRVRQQ